MSQETGSRETVITGGPGRGARRPRSLAERGMATVEYAIGIVLVVTIVAVIIKAAQDGWFLDLVKNLVGALFKVVMANMGV